MNNNLPPVTKHLLIINVLLWFGGIAMTRLGYDFNNIFGLHFFKASDFRIWQLFTYMFMHAGFQHVFFNMFAVWMFGGIMEKTWGSRRFLFFYLACGIGAGLMQEGVQYIHWLVDLSHYAMVDMGGITITMNEYLNSINTVGASGAVYGILLGYGMTYPDNQIFIIPIPVPIKAKWLVTGYVILELLLGLGNRVGDNVAHFAHLGGMLVGFLIILYWRRQYRPRKPRY